jgi:hypothetical protein
MLASALQHHISCLYKLYTPLDPSHAPEEQGQAFQWIDYGQLASLAEWLNLSHDGPILTLARVRGQYKQSWRPAK